MSATLYRGLCPTTGVAEHRDIVVEMKRSLSVSVSNAGLGLRYSGRMRRLVLDTVSRPIDRGTAVSATPDPSATSR